MTGGGDVRAQGEFRPDAFDYRAFVSYSRADIKIVDAMFKRLSRFRTPRQLVRRKDAAYGAPPRALRLFLDRKSAELGATIPDRLQAAIARSAFLIVFCSRDARTSVWVDREIEAFLENAEPFRVLPVFIDRRPGEPLENFMPPALAALGERMPLGADLALDGGPVPVAHKLVGAMIGLPQDVIAREQERADRVRRRVERVALTLIAGLSLAAAALGWYAASEARKSERSLLVALDSLETTTPFVRRLLSEGRVTTQDVEGFLSDLAKLFDSMSDDDLKGLDDIRYGFGQVLTDFARLEGVTGAAAGRAESADRARRLLTTFRDDPGPQTQVLICDAALEAADALASVGRYGDAIGAARGCDAIAAFELGYHDAASPEIAPLVARRARAKSAEARLLAALGRFTEALEAHDAAEGGEQLGAMAAVDLTSQRTASRELGADLTVARAQTLEAMGRYEEAGDGYREAVMVYEELGLPPLRAAAAQRGAIRAEGVIGDEHASALARIAALAEPLEAEAARDPSQRGVSAFLAQLELDRAQVHSYRPPGDVAAGGPDPAEEAAAAFARAGAIYAQLLAFDARNAQWRRGDAVRLDLLGDFYFRLFEQYGEAAPVCADHCLAESADALAQALDRLGSIDVGGADLLETRTDVELRLARTLRTAGDAAGARAHVEAAETLHAAFARATDNQNDVALLGSRVLDERADLLAADGDFKAALERYYEALAVHRDSVAREPGWVMGRRDLVWTELRVAETLRDDGQQASAGAAFARACADALEAEAFRSRLLLRDVASVRDAAAAAGEPCPAPTAAGATPP